MEEPEIIKMLKYILLIGTLTSCVQCHPLVTEQPAVVPVPINHSGEQYSEVVASLITSSQPGGSGQKITGTAENGNNNPISLLQKGFSTENAGSGGRVHMSPVPHISEIQDEFSPNNTGGQKHVRQIQPEGPPGPLPNTPPPSDELCSIFQFFLEPRRYSRCRVSNTYTDPERNDALPPRPSGELEQPEFNFNPNFHRSISNEVVPSIPEDTVAGDNFSSESENREIESGSHRQVVQLSPRMEIDRRVDREPISASKRYDQLEELHGGPPPDESHHLVGPPPPPPGPPPMYPKSSLDRTTIIVPERPCRRGERRDHKGFCRRIVRPAPSYQYGPPPPPYGPSRPFRYYYSRFVSVPTLQFFIPAVP